MAVQKSRPPPSKRGMRASTNAFTHPAFSEDQETYHTHLPPHITSHGYSLGKPLIKAVDDIEEVEA